MKRWMLALSVWAALMPGGLAHAAGKSAARAQWRAFCAAQKQERQAFSRRLEAERKDFLAKHPEVAQRAARKAPAKNAGGS